MDIDRDSGGRGNPLHKLYRYVPPHRVGFLRRFGLKTGIHFAHFGLNGYTLCPFGLKTGIHFAHSGLNGYTLCPFWSENGYTLCPFWSAIGYSF